MSSPSKSAIDGPKPVDNVLLVSPSTSTSPITSSALLKSEESPIESTSETRSAKDDASKLSSSIKTAALHVWREDREKKWDTLARWSGDDLFPYDLVYSPNVGKTLRKYEGKLQLLKLQGQIEELDAIVAEESIKFAKMQEHILPLTLQREKLATEASNAAAVLEAKRSEILELEASVDIENSVPTSAADLLKARKAELKISKLQGELLETEIKTLEAGIALDLKTAEIEAENKPVRDAGSVLATIQYDAVLLKEEYKKAFLVWHDEFEEEVSLTGHVEDESITFNCSKAEEEVIFGESKEELVAALAEVESLSNQNTVLIAATKADAEQLVTLETAESEIKSENTKLSGRFDILEKEINVLKSDVEAGQKKIAVLEAAELILKNEKISAINDVQVLENEINFLKSDASANNELIIALKEEKISILNQVYRLQKELEAWKATTGFATKSHVQGLYGEIEALRAREVLHKMNRFKYEDLIEEKENEIACLKAAWTAANTIEGQKNKNMPANIIGTEIVSPKENGSSDDKLKSVINSLKYELAYKEPLWIIGQKVRVRHNIQQMRNKWGGQFNFNEQTFNEGYECVNSGKAIADATIYQDDASYKRDQRNFEEIYGVPAMVVLKHRNFGIFIQTLNMGVDMKIYSPEGVPSESFLASFHMVLNRLSPSFEISSDEEFNKYPELVVAFNHMCEQRSEVYHAAEYVRRATLEHTWDEPAWIDYGYEGDHLDQYAE
ncbi:hypothetical protein BUE80_DR002544 [Diplocarpon rosae]|nr:hypothetical protein BUE80_DR002544 [Diplocarpon rosae]